MFQKTYSFFSRT